MSFLSFCSLAKPPAVLPTTVFTGPSPKSTGSSVLALLGSSSSGNETISITNPSTNTTQPLFSVETSKSKPNLTISRIQPNGSNGLLATITLSSASSKSIIQLFTRTQQAITIEVKTDMMSASGSRKFSCSQGNFHWKPKDSGTGHKLIMDDGSKTEIARYLTSDSLTLSTKGFPRLEILGQYSDEFVEVVLVTGLAVLKAEEKEAKQAIKVVKFMTGDVGSLLTGSS